MVVHPRTVNIFFYENANYMSLMDSVVNIHIMLTLYLLYTQCLYDFFSTIVYCHRDSLLQVNAVVGESNSTWQPDSTTTSILALSTERG